MPPLSLPTPMPGLTLLVEAQTTLAQLVTTLTQQEQRASEQKRLLLSLSEKTSAYERTIDSLSGQLTTLGLELSNSRRAQGQLQSVLDTLSISLGVQSSLSEDLPQALRETLAKADDAVAAALATARRRLWLIPVAAAGGVVVGLFADWIVDAIREALHPG